MNIKKKKDKLTILFVLHADITAGGGSERVVLQYISHADPVKFEIVLLQTDFKDISRLNQEVLKPYLKNVKVFTIKRYDQKLNFLKTGWRFPFFLISYLILLILERSILYPSELKGIPDTDVVYFTQNDDSRFIKKRNSLFVGSNHVGLPNSRLRKGSFLWNLELKLIQLGLIYRKMDAFHIFPSNRQIAGYFNRKSVFVAPNGVDTNLYFPTPAQKVGPVKFLFVARLEEYKGIIQLLEAWQKIIDKKGCELHIVGEGNLTDYVRNRLDTGITYHGTVNDVELSELYRICDIFIFPTHWEGENFGLVILEALSSGMYVLVSSVLSGIFDDFEKERALEYVDPDVGSIQAAIASHLFRESIPDFDKFALHELVKETYSWDKVCDDIYSFFNDLVETDRGIESK